MSAVRRFRTTHIALASLAAIVLLPAASAGAVSAPPESGARGMHAIKVVHSRGHLTDLQPAIVDPTDGARARATAVAARGRTLVVLHLQGLDRTVAGRTFGAHVHAGTCVAGDGAAAGPHYNHDVATGVTPVEFSEDTEIWLDFTVTRRGTATAVAVVPFTIARGAAGAIVVHQDETEHGTGVAGPRLACLPMRF